MLTISNLQTMADAPTLPQLQKLNDYKKQTGARFQTADFDKGILSITYKAEGGLTVVARFDQHAKFLGSTIKTGE